MTHPFLTLLIVASIVTVARSNAAVTVASPFSDHAVLQRGIPVPVWGTADAGAEVKVSFRGNTKSATTDKDGNAMTRDGGPEV